MGVEEQLQTGEEIVYRAHVTRISLIPWVVGVAVVLAAGLLARNLLDGNPAPLFGSLAVCVVLLAVIGVKLVMLRFQEHVLTDRRVIQQVGVLNRRSMDARLDKINNVEHRQTIWGRLLGYGDLEIDTASETGATRFHKIRRPLDFKRAIMSAAEAYRARGIAGPVVAAVSPAEKIRQLKALLDDGLISAQEFEGKRRQLLEEM
jgi:uncharacterized membrane protein YdbT with pleckstrin-like domain